MPTPTIRTVTDADLDQTMAVLVLAFSADPIERWVYPDPHQYLVNFGHFISAFAGRAFVSGSAYVADEFGGAALWLPPGVAPDEQAVAALLERTVPAHRLTGLYAMLEQMGRFHPSEPHWYLPLIGVEPSRQGQGVGDALIDHTLHVVDHDHRPAYLESSNPKNISLYERHGFELLGTIQTGDSPSMFPMLRKAR